MRTSAVLLVTLVVGCGGRVVDDTHDATTDAPGVDTRPTPTDSVPTPIDVTPPGPPCVSCTNAYCRSELDDCVASSTCKSGIECLNACPIPDRGNVCANRCISDHVDDTKFYDLVDCMNTRCKRDCFPG